MEFISLGSVKDLLHVLDRCLEEEEIAEIMFATLKGLNYLHSQAIIHRDIKVVTFSKYFSFKKAANILLGQGGDVKIGKLTFFNFLITFS
jgi:serine/threonine protein kinase